MLEENIPFLTDEIESAEMQIPRSFAITDERTANWVVRKINEARKYAEECAAWAKSEAARSKRVEDFFVSRFGESLKEIVAEQLGLDQNRGKKSLKLPAGTVGFRHSKANVVVSDKQALLDWCRESLPTAILYSESVRKEEVNSYFFEHGVLPPGCELEPEGDKFFVK